MAVKFVFGEPRLDAYVLCHQCYNLMSKCEEVMFAKVGLTPQQYIVLMAIKYLPEPVTPTDVAKWLDRNTNSITLITDRMEKNGLVKREWGLRDRRSLRLVMTPKGKETLDQAFGPGWEFIQKMMSRFSEEELQTFVGLMEKVRAETFEYLNPGEVMEKAQTKDVENIARLSAGEDTDD